MVVRIRKDRSRGISVLLLCCLQAAGGQRDLRGWSQQTRLSDTPDGHVYPNRLPKAGSCLNGTILKSLVTTSVTQCELMCGTTKGCRWFAYCASHMDVSLPVEHHAYVFQYCNDDLDFYGVDPMKRFGKKRDKCVLYSQCFRVGLDVNSTLPLLGFNVYEYAPRGVMTGRQTDFFPEQLPEKLKVKFHVPDSLHPNLRFWFTPDSLDMEGHKNGDRVKVWKNIANICHPRHPDFAMNPRNASILLGNCNPSVGDYYLRGSWPQEYGEVTNFVNTFGNMQKEILYQHNPKEMPQYRSNVVNGHSVLRFKRQNTLGTQGKFMYMYTNTLDGDKKGFQDEARNPFATKSSESSNVPSYRGVDKEMTLFVVVKTFSEPGDRDFHGIFNVVGKKRLDRWKGMSIFKNSPTCAGRGKTPTCIEGFTSFSALNMVFGVQPKYSYNDCSTVCGRQGCALTSLEMLTRRDCSCPISTPHPACLDTLGPPGFQHLQNPDNEWRLISVRTRDKKVEGFLDGYHASPKSPFLYENEDYFELVDQLRIGVLDEPESASRNFLNGEIAEILIYNKALTTQEMDRIANYLTTKFALKNVRLDNDAASPTRSVALSKPPGCEGSTVLQSVCNASSQHLTPYGKEALIEVHMGEPYDVQRGYCPNLKPQQNDFEIFTLTGWFLLPTDLDVTGAHQVIPSAIADLDLSLNEQYLKVTIGEDEATEAHCHIHTVPVTGSWVCKTTGLNFGPLGGRRHELPLTVRTEFMNASNVLSRRLLHDSINTTCADGNLEWVGPATGDVTDFAWTTEEEGFKKPALRCKVFGGIREGKLINLYWHGIKTVITSWRRCGRDLSPT